MVIKTKRQLQIEELQRHNRELELKISILGKDIETLREKNIELKLEVSSLTGTIKTLQQEITNLKSNYIEPEPLSKEEQQKLAEKHMNLLDQYLNGPTKDNGGVPVLWVLDIQKKK